MCGDYMAYDADIYIFTAAQTAITEKYALQNAIIVEFSQHGHATEVIEKIVLNFQKVTLSVTAGSATTSASLNVVK